MARDEFERKMEFILQQQAQFDADIQRMKEEDKQLKASLTRAARLIDQLATHVLERARDVDTKLRDFDAKIAALVDGQIRLDHSQEKRTAEFNARMESTEVARVKSERNFYARMQSKEAARVKSERNFYARMESMEKAEAKRDRAFNIRIKSLATAQAKTDRELRKLVTNWNRSGRRRSSPN